MNWVNLGTIRESVIRLIFTLVMAKINYEYFEFALKKEIPWGFYAPSLLYSPTQDFWLS